MAEVVAFANKNGGTIYIGIQDNGEIAGLENPDFLMQQISNALRDSIRPDVTMFTNIELAMKESKSILKITVQQGTKNIALDAFQGEKTALICLMRATCWQKVVSGFVLNAKASLVRD